MTRYIIVSSNPDTGSDFVINRKLGWSFFYPAVNDYQFRRFGSVEEAAEYLMDDTGYFQNQRIVPWRD